MLQGLNGRLVFAIAAAAVGSSFQHGYNTGVVNAPQKLIEDFIRNVMANRTGGTTTVAEISQESVTMIWAIAVSIFCVGGMIGGTLVGYVANTFGRKGGLLWNNVFVFVAALLQGFSKSANSYEMIIAGRFFIGINSGLNAGLAPMYLAEISPVHLRGAVGTTYQLVLTISILISQILGLGSVLGTVDLWPMLLAATAVPAIFMVFALPVCPESPKYLLSGKSQELEARRVASNDKKNRRPTYRTLAFSAKMPTSDMSDVGIFAENANVRYVGHSDAENESDIIVRAIDDNQSDLDDTDDDPDCILPSDNEELLDSEGDVAQISLPSISTGRPRGGLPVLGKSS
ncbi:Solute carrier 2, facilitated glucose transporter member 4 [Homalodisca vitripennis]|nr:Solute carrier 2, facilitated glucose transporter member 4 [Homalodisca vitripennis]